MTACIMGPGTPNADGYTRQRRDGRVQYAHRLAWIDAHGSIPVGMTVDHECFEPRCVNVEHLSLATNAENRRRAWARADRTRCKRGHPRTPGAPDCATCHRERQAAYLRRCRDRLRQLPVTAGR